MMKMQKEHVTVKEIEREKMTVKKIIMKNLPMIITTCFLMVLICGNVVGAATTAEDMWDETMKLVKTWVTRLGLVVVFVGAVMFGLGFKNDDAEAKTRGINTMIAGGIVAAATSLVTNLLVTP